MNNRTHPRHTPATLTYVSAGDGNGGILLNLSEQGCSLQLVSPPRTNTQIDLEIELEPGTRIRATGTIVWVDESGCVGVRFDRLNDAARTQLRNWLAKATPAPPADDELAELESILDLGPDSPSGGGTHSGDDFLFDAVPEENPAAVAVTQASFAAHLTQLSTAAAYIALAEESCTRSGANASALAVLSDKEMICRASAGTGAPPAGARLDITSDRSFTAQSVKLGKTLRCVDTANDARVNAAVCQRLGIRSVAAVPLMLEKRVVGLLEVFSSQRDAFKEETLPGLEELAQIAAEFSVARGEIKAGAGLVPVEVLPEVAKPVEKIPPVVVAPSMVPPAVKPAAFAAAAPAPAIEKPSEKIPTAPPVEKPQPAKPAATTPAWAPAIPQPKPTTRPADVKPPKPAETELQPMAAAVETVPEAPVKARKSAASAAEVSLPSFVGPAKGRGKMPMLVIAAVLVIAVIGAGWWMMKRRSANQPTAAAVQPAPVVTAPVAATTQPVTPAPAEVKPNAKPTAAANTAPGNKPEQKPEQKPKTNAAPAPVMAVTAGGGSRPQAEQEVAPPTVNIATNSGLPSGLMSTAAVIPGKPVAVSTGAQEGRLIHRVEPHYPEIAKRSGRGGTVRLAVTISTEGKVKKVKILEGSPIFAGAAQDAVMQWRYRPFMLDGKPTEVETEVTVKFENPH